MKLVRKMIAGAAAASLIASPVFVMAEEAASSPINGVYGFSLEADGSRFDADYVLKTDADNNAAVSVNVTVTSGEEEINIPLEDIVIGSGEDMYLNVAEIVKLFEDMSGETGTEYMLNAIGITSDWVKLELPDFSKIIVEAAPGAPAMEISDELLGELPAIIAPFTPVEEDGAMVIYLNNDNVLAAASAMDEILQKHGDEIMGLTNRTGSSTISELDIKPALEGYLKAVAAGMAQAMPDLTEEDAEASINAMVDMFTQQVLDSIQTQSSVQGVDLTPETIGEINIHDSIAQQIESSPVDGKIVIGAEGIEATLKNADGQEAKVMITSAENGVDLVASIGEEELLRAGYGLDESGLTAYIMDPKGSFSIDFAGSFEILEKGFNFSGALIMDAGGSSVDLSAYGNFEETEVVEAIEVPTDAVSSYDVVKAVSYFYFDNMIKAAEAEAAEAEAAEAEAAEAEAAAE